MVNYVFCWGFDSDCFLWEADVRRSLTGNQCSSFERTVTNHELGQLVNARKALFGDGSEDAQRLPSNVARTQGRLRQEVKPQNQGVFCIQEILFCTGGVCLGYIFHVSFWVQVGGQS